MRLSNKSRAPIYNFINTALIFFACLGVFIYLADRYELHTLGLKSLIFMIGAIIALVIFYIRGKQIFEYDSDGEALNFKNRGILPIFGQNISDEFPKYKLMKYEIVNAIIFKRLYITIYSKKQNSSTLKYEISYLTTKEIRDLKMSLNRVLKANKELPPPPYRK